jgi:hypothetical protein
VRASADGRGVALDAPRAGSAPHVPRLCKTLGRVRVSLGKSHFASKLTALFSVAYKNAGNAVDWNLDCGGYAERERNRSVARSIGL